MSAAGVAAASPLPSGERVRVRGRTGRARALRQNSTDAEQKLWSLLRNRQIRNLKFVRQFPVGRYFVDFACREMALVIELDGGQHNEEADESRTAYLNSEGYAVLRFWNHDVLSNSNGVAEAIVSVLDGHPSPDWRFAPATLSPEGRGKRGIAAATAKKRRKRQP